MNRKVFRPGELQLVAPAEAFPRTPPRIGKRVRLNSGGPVMLIVDHDGDMITVAWTNNGKAVETVISNACVKDEP